MNISVFVRVCLWGALFAGMSAIAVSAAQYPVPPHHPTVISVEVGGARHPVLHATRTGRPVIKDGQKTRTLPEKNRLWFDRTKAYTAGYVELKEPADGQLFYGEGSYLRLKASSDRPLRQCMAAMVTLPRQGTATKEPSTRDRADRHQGSETGAPDRRDFRPGG